MEKPDPLAKHLLSDSVTVCSLPLATISFLNLANLYMAISLPEALNPQKVSTYHLTCLTDVPIIHADATPDILLDVLLIDVIVVSHLATPGDTKMPGRFPGSNRSMLTGGSVLASRQSKSGNNYRPSLSGGLRH